VNVTEQEPLERVQTPPLLKVPVEGELWENVTVPVGVMGVPASVSVTVTVHVDGLPTTTGLAHTTVVEVERTQVTEAEFELIEWSVSPPYEPVIVTVPAKLVFGVYVRVQEAGVPLRMQVPPLLNVPEDAGLWVSVIVPVGVTEVPPEVSVTVMTQFVGMFRFAVEGVQTIDVEVDRCVAVRVPLPVLVTWCMSPA